MNLYESLSHTKWECKYHVIFIPKYRRKALYRQLRAHMGPVFRELARQRQDLWKFHDLNGLSRLLLQHGGFGRVIVADVRRLKGRTAR